MEIPKIIENFFDNDKVLISFPSKKKKQLYVLLYLATKFETNKEYTEKEINEIINQNTYFKDPATIRREMYNNFFFNRTNDCKKYWLSEPLPTAVSLKLE